MSAVDLTYVIVHDAQEAVEPESFLLVLDKAQRLGLSSGSIRTGHIVRCISPAPARDWKLSPDISVI
jgi:hypothetical protein